MARRQHPHILPRAQHAGKHSTKGQETLGIRLGRPGLAGRPACRASGRPRRARRHGAPRRRPAAWLAGSRAGGGKGGCRTWVGRLRAQPPSWKRRRPPGSRAPHHIVPSLPPLGPERPPGRATAAARPAPRHAAAAAAAGARAQPPAQEAAAGRRQGRPRLPLRQQMAARFQQSIRDEMECRRDLGGPPSFGAAPLRTGAARHVGAAPRRPEGCLPLRAHPGTRQVLRHHPQHGLGQRHPGAQHGAQRGARVRGGHVPGGHAVPQPKAGDQAPQHVCRVGAGVTRSVCLRPGANQGSRAAGKPQASACRKPHTRARTHTHTRTRTHTHWQACSHLP